MMATQFWGFPVQWSDKFSVTAEYKTEIISSASGKEQRRAMRVYPRRSFSFKLDALPAIIDEVQFFLVSAQRNTVVMPEPVRRQRTTSALAAGQGSVSVTSIAAWMKEGGYVALVGKRGAEVLRVGQIDGDTLFFSEPNIGPWPSNSRIVPAWPGLLSESMSFSFATDRVMQGSVEFAVRPGSEIISDTPARFADYLYGREAFSFRTNWKDSPDVTITQDRQIIDYGRGVIAMFDPVPYASRAYGIDVLNFSPEDAYRLTAFFDRMKGRQGEFFFTPPASPKMAPFGNYTGNDILVLRGGVAKRSFEVDPGFRVIAIRMEYGAVHYRKVLSVTATGAGNSALKLSAPVNEIISEDTVRSINWVVLARLEADDLTIDWQTTNVSTARVVVRTLEYVEPEDADTFDEGTRWLLDYYGAGFVESVMIDPTLRVLNVQEPRFALIVDAGTQYLIDRYGRDPADRWTLEGTNRVLNVAEPKFAEV